LAEEPTRAREFGWIFLSLQSIYLLTTISAFPILTPPFPTNVEIAMSQQFKTHTRRVRVQRLISSGEYVRDSGLTHQIHCINLT
jgi:hypothetical protein